MGYISTDARSPLFSGHPIVHGRTLTSLFLAAALTGCDTAMPSKPADEAPTPLAADFHEANCGTIRGTVCWSGEQPQVAPIRAPVNPLGGEGVGRLHLWKNPNLPLVDATTGGVRDAVVYLRHVDPDKSMPWDYASVHVTFRDDELFVEQGDYAGRRGFVRRGSKFTIVSKEAESESLQARGAAFFNLTLPDAQTSRARCLDQAGVVEVSSGIGRFWMRGHLFVAEHPYFTRTDLAGHFTLPNVPAGKYQLVCWHPNWREDVREHDADTNYVSRMMFRPAAEVGLEIEVRAGETGTVVFTLSQKDFPP
jgi:hypothetical protein